MMYQHTRVTTFAAAIFAALALAACDQSQPSRTSSVAPARTDEPPSNSPQTTSPAPVASSAMDSQSSATDKIATATDDAAVTTKVKAALLAEPGLRSTEIHVDTKDGVVTLTGTPESNATRDRAVVIARNVSGVKDVIDQMASKS